MELEIQNGELTPSAVPDTPSDAGALLDAIRAVVRGDS